MRFQLRPKIIGLSTGPQQGATVHQVTEAVREDRAE